MRVVSVPVVMRADMIIAGDQSRWNDLTYAAALLACGHAMDVPESMLYRTFLLSPGTSLGDATGDHAAMMSIPGADRSGCKFRDRFQLRHQEFPLDHRSKK